MCGSVPRQYVGAMSRLGLPDGVRACLFDLDGVLTDTAAVHRAAWREVFDALLAARGLPPFTDEDYLRYVDGRQRRDGVRDFLASRAIVLNEGSPVTLPKLTRSPAWGTARTSCFWIGSPARVSR